MYTQMLLFKISVSVSYICLTVLVRVIDRPVKMRLRAFLLFLTMSRFRCTLLESDTADFVPDSLL